MVDADGLGATIVGFGNALVDVSTSLTTYETIALETLSTSTLVTAFYVVTLGIGDTIVSSGQTLVDVGHTVGAGPAFAALAVGLVAIVDLAFTTLGSTGFIATVEVTAWVGQNIALLACVVLITKTVIGVAIGIDSAGAVLGAVILVACVQAVFVELTVLANEGRGALANVSVVSIDTGAAVLALVLRAGIVLLNNGVNVVQKVVDIGVDTGILG